jgi:ribosome maturation factor RimP
MADLMERVRSAVEPVLAPLALELLDVEVVGSGRARTLRLSVDRDGGVDLDAITQATRLVSPALDDLDPISGSYTLEVSSPGVERPLKLPEHFRRVVGETVSVKTHVEVEGERRHRGVLTEVDDEGAVVEVEGSPRRLRFEDMAHAHTVFEWGPAPRPGASAKKTGKTGKAGKKAGRTRTR